MKLEILFNELTTYSINNEQVSIFGTPYCTIFGQYSFMGGDEKLDEMFSEIPVGVDILLAHNPPYNMCNVDLLYQDPKRGHVGNHILTNHIYRTKPKYVICGHLHSGNHNMENINGINMVNVSMIDEECEPVYVPFVFNFK
jgi:Icc-related predicted phosphoesterase